MFDKGWLESVHRSELSTAGLRLSMCLVYASVVVRHRQGSNRLLCAEGRLESLRRLFRAKVLVHFLLQTKK